MRKGSKLRTIPGKSKGQGGRTQESVKEREAFRVDNQKTASEATDLCALSYSSNSCSEKMEKARNSNRVRRRRRKARVLLQTHRNSKELRGAREKKERTEYQRVSCGTEENLISQELVLAFKFLGTARISEEHGKRKGDWSQADCVGAESQRS